MKPGSAIVDRPRTVTGVLVVIVGVHALLARFTTGVIPTFAHALRNADGVSELYLGAAAFVGMVGGFAGVLVVFAMTQGLRRFSVLRVAGGEALEANWIHPITITLSAGFLLLAAAFCQMTDRATYGTWLFELAILLALHGSARLVWLLSRLVTAVRLQDVDDLQPKATLAQAVPNAPRRVS
ncbi:MAG: hypothetical protein H7288_12450 [Kineosporiaceae bacterium]|nr:hypothetical protein [Aeromicrobium sp.]